MRAYWEPVNILSGYAANVNGRTIISDPLPVGEGWYVMYVRIGIVLTIGTGSGAITEGELLFIKNVLLKTDRGEIICNLPGRAIYKLATYLAGSPPDKDAIAASSATYYVNLPIFFADDQKYIERPEDTVLDTSRYSSVTIELTLGTTVDLLTTPGTSTVTATVDAEVLRVKGLLPPKAKPIGYRSYDVRPPVDASSVVQIFMERATDLALRRVVLHSCTGGSAGVPFSGVNANTIINVLQIKDQSGFIIKDRIWRMMQNENKDRMSLESLITGLAVIEFIRDGSNQSALVTAGKPLLQASWTNQGGVGANSLVTLMTDGIRGLK